MSKQPPIIQWCHHQKNLLNLTKNPSAKAKKSDEETQPQGSFFVPPSLSFKRTGRSVAIIHNKHLCVWCMRPDILAEIQSYEN